MARHYNPSINEDAMRILNTKSSDTLSSEVMPLTPVIPITRYINIVKRGSTVNAASATAYTTPSDKDFFITAITFTMIKDATATATTHRVVATIEGVSTVLLEINALTLTADSQSITLSLSLPLKIDRNTAINVTNDTAVANIKAAAIIYGYTVETIKGV